jgi:hypothetical protein
LGFDGEHASARAAKAACNDSEVTLIGTEIDEGRSGFEICFECFSHASLVFASAAESDAQEGDGVDSEGAVRGWEVDASDAKQTFEGGGYGGWTDLHEDGLKAAMVET